MQKLSSLTKIFYLVVFLILATVITLGAIWSMENFRVDKGQYVDNKTLQENMLRVGYFPAMLHLPVIIAFENGYFNDEGLNVELVRFESSRDEINALANHEIEFTTVSQQNLVPALITSPNLAKVTAVSVLSKTMCTHSILVHRNNSHLNTIHDLKGHTLAGIPGAMPVIKPSLIKLGLDKDVELLPLSNNLLLPALESGQVDAIFALEPLPTIAKIQGTTKTIDKCTQSYVADPGYTNVIIIGTDFIQKNPEQAKKIKKAIDRAIDFYMNHGDEANKLLPKYTSISEEIILEMPLPKELSPYITSEDLDKNSFQKSVDAMYELGSIEQKFDTSNIFYYG